jgi:hypothetical protein
VATKEECAAALDQLAEKMGGIDSQERSKNLLERSVSCEIPDLKVTFHGDLKDARLNNVRAYAAPEPVPNAQIRLVIPSDDLIALVNGQLSFIPAWTSGRIKVNASFGDLLKLRKIF